MCLRPLAMLHCNLNSLSEPVELMRHQPAGLTPGRLKATSGWFKFLRLGSCRGCLCFTGSGAAPLYALPNN